MERQLAMNLQAGQKIVNVGTIHSIKVYDMLTQIVVTEGPCMSAAFYWYRSTESIWVYKS